MCREGSTSRASMDLQILCRQADPNWRRAGRAGQGTGSGVQGGQQLACLHEFSQVHLKAGSQLACQPHSQVPKLLRSCPVAGTSGANCMKQPTGAPSSLTSNPRQSSPHIIRLVICIATRTRPLPPAPGLPQPAGARLHLAPQRAARQSSPQRSNPAPGQGGGQYV